MEIITMTTSPLAPLTPACAPSVSPLAPAAAPRPFPASVERAPISVPAPAPVAVLAAERAPVSRVHQVLVQAELGVMALLASEINGTNGFNGTTGSISTTGFTGTKVSIDNKRYVDGFGGAPPRGRPV